MFSPNALPAELDAVLGQVRGWTASVDAAVGPDERAAWLVGLRELVDATEAVFTSALARFGDSDGDGETLHGARSTAAWLQGGLHLAPGDASARVRVARGSSGHLSAPIAALAKGVITFDQVQAIERSVRVLPSGSQPQAVDLLTNLARWSTAAGCGWRAGRCGTRSILTAAWPRRTRSSSGGTSTCPRCSTA